MAVGSEGNVVESAVVASILGIDCCDALGAELLYNTLGSVVDQVQVRRGALVGENHRRVATHDCAFHSTHLQVAALGFAKLEAVGELEIDRLHGVGIVLIGNCGRYVGL